MFIIEDAELEKAIEKAKDLHPKVRVIRFGEYVVSSSKGGRGIYRQALQRGESKGRLLLVPDEGRHSLQAWRGGCQPTCRISAAEDGGIELKENGLTKDANFRKPHNIQPSTGKEIIKCRRNLLHRRSARPIGQPAPNSERSWRKT